jgi:drug/metabolite transporter (DMT)-like permease
MSPVEPAGVGPAELAAPQTNYQKGFAFSVGATLCIATMYPLGKFAMPGMGGAPGWALVFAVAGSVFSVLMLLVTGQARHIVLRRDLWGSVLAIGLLNGVGAVGFWAGLERIDPTFASTLGRMLPVLCVLGGVVFYGERISRWELLPVLLIITGGIGAVAGRPSGEILGVGLTLGGCVMGASQFILAKRIVHDVPVGALTAWRMIFAVPLVATWAWSTGRLDFSAAEPLHWSATLTAAFLVSYLSRTLNFHAYRHWPIAYTSIVDFSQPVFVLPLALLLLGEMPDLQGIVGGVVIIVGGVWLVLAHRHSRKIATLQAEATEPQ